jgi:hypothetical protein
MARRPHPTVTLRETQAVHVTMTDWALFAKKTAAVFALSLLLVPLVEMKGGVPGVVYMVGLVAVHLFVLVIYFYRVRFRELDPDPRSLLARVGALIFMVYLLTVASNFDEATPMSTLLLQMLGVSVLHAIVLALLMVRVDRRRYATASSLIEDAGDR